MPTATTNRPKQEERAPRSYGKARRSEGPEIPQVPDGTYVALILDITETDSLYGGTQLKIKWEILDEDLRKANGNYQDIGSFVAIPETLVTDGKLNENSNMFKLMNALGFDMNAEELDVDPPSWQGMECQISVENRTVKEGDHAGQVRPKIAAYTRLPKALRGQQAEPPPPPTRQAPPPRPASAPAPRPAAAATTVRRTSQAAAPAAVAADDDNDF